MKNLLADLLIKLGLDSKEFDSGIESAKQKTNLFADGIKKIGGMIAGAFAVSAIVGFAKQIFALANESIRVENELGAAIRANGKDVETTMAAYKAFANEMQNKSTIDDEATLSALRLAETLQSKAPIEATRNAIALSKAIGVDLNTAVKMAVMAQSDMYTMLGRYVPALRTAGTEAQRTAEYHKLLASGQQMLTAEMDTAAGKIIQNQNAWDNLKETLGTIISQSSILNTVLVGTNGILKVLNGNLKWYQKLHLLLTGQVGLAVAQTQLLADAESEAAQKAAAEANANVKLKGALEDTAEATQKAIDKKKALIEVGELTGGFGTMPKMETQAIGGVKGELSFDLDYEKLAERNQEIIDFYAEQQAKFNQFKEAMAYSVSDFGINVVEEFGNAMGEFIASGEFPKDFGKNILSIIGGFLSQLGKMLILYGLAQTAFWESFKMGPIGAVTAIAAGAALVAAGAMFSGMAKAGPTGASGSGSVSQSSYSGASNPAGQGRDYQAKVVFELDGVKLRGVLKNVDRKYAIIG